MAQSPSVINSITITAGTAIRVVSDPDDQYRYVKSASFAPALDNAGNVYVGGDDVSDTVYVSVLVGANGDELDLIGDTVFDSKSDRNNFIDLYNTWVDGDNNGDLVNVGILK